MRDRLLACRSTTNCREIMDLARPSPQVIKLIANILKTGLLRIRCAGWRGDAELCAIEADHIHNLPHFLVSPTGPLLEFYRSVERKSYLEALRRHRGAKADSREFEALWLELAEHLGRTGTGEQEDR